MSLEIKAWKCEKCGGTWLDEQIANRCCEEKPANKCRVCGCNVKYPSTLCTDCREKERYEKAKKIKYSEYKEDYVYDENKQNYYRDKEDLEETYYDDAYDEGQKPVYPDWCYGCTSFTFELNVESAIERESEEMYEDFDEIDIVDLQELTDFMEVWNKKQTAKTYYPDYKTVILLNE